MFVILKEKIRNLGNLGDKVKVANGYARNFLFPQDKAMPASERNLKLFEAQRAELERLESSRSENAGNLAAKLSALVLTLKGKAGEGGKLFGSIGSRDLADAISQQTGETIARHQIRLPEGVLRQVGEFEVEVHLYSDVDAKIKVFIEAE